MTSPDTSPVGFRAATRVWAYVGLNSFGGPAGQIAVMHREVVDRRRWISEQRFLNALNYCMILPGPEAQQLATYIGWLMHGVRGGAVAGALFVLPGFVVMMVLSAVYVVYGQVGWVAGLLFGLQAAVVAIVLQAVIRVGSRTLHSPALVGLAIGAFVALFFFAVPFPVVIGVAAVLGWGSGRLGWMPAPPSSADHAVDSRPHLLPDDEAVPRSASRRALRAAGICLVLWLLPVVVLVATLGTDNIFTQEALLFSKTAVLTFGGAYAVLAYVSQQAVDRYGWLTTEDMATGLGLAETTPGPLIMVVQFVGFVAAYNNPGALPPLLAGVLGATITVWVTFVPCFFFIFLGAPYVERLRHNDAVRNSLAAVGAAVVGVIANLGVWFAGATLFEASGSVNWVALGITGVALVLILGLRWGTLTVLAVCAALGAGASLAGVV